jgi:hypothetical protein
MTPFVEHGPNCTPLAPCAACDLVAWLRSKLSEEDFSILVDRVADINQAKPKRTYKRRNRQAIEPEAA